MFPGIIAAVAVAALQVVEPRNAELTATAVEIVRAQKLPYEVTVLVPQSWRAKGIVNARTNRTAIADVVIIRISPILVEETDAKVHRAILAHELAHLEDSCGPKYRNEKEELRCEHKADALSAKWIGRTAALRALCYVMAISFEWRFKTDASDTIERIRLLHNRTEISREVPVP